MLWLLCCFFWVVPAFAGMKCGSGTADGAGYKWCIQQEANSSNHDVLYYFHGATGSEKSWNEEDNTTRIRAAWAKLGVDTPSVVSLSFGPLWLVGDVATAQHPALLNSIVREILPAMEAKLTRKVERRILLGTSMGGFNVAQVSLRNPKLFSRVAMLCPALSSMSPFSTDEAIEKYIRSQSFLSREAVLWALRWVRSDFPNEATFLRNSPMHLAELSAPGIPYFVSCTPKDEFGFYEGARSFAGLVKGTWFSIPEGQHCVQNEESIAAVAAFLVAKP
jgi:pimeloyl-ACP methyl ester carboxylesterase